MSGIQLTEEFIQKLMNGDRQCLSKAITLVESHQENDRSLAKQLMSRIQAVGTSMRIGITGPPGVGKSSLIEALGLEMIHENQQRLAVLSIDPSSAQTQGSILGDKTRMIQLSQSDLVFIRPSPSGTQLGGIAKNTRETIRLCEAAGYRYILVETAGIGQTEYLVSTMTDLTILMHLPGSGDDVQGIKRGVMEWADLMVVNKADQPEDQRVINTLKDLHSVLHFLPSRGHGYAPKVLSVSALNRKGIPELWGEIKAFEKHINENGYILINRKQQLVNSFRQQLPLRLWESMSVMPGVKQNLEDTEEKILSEDLSPEEAVDLLQDFIFASLRTK